MLGNRTEDQIAKFVEGLQKGIADAFLKPRSDLDMLRGDPYIADGYSRGYSVGCSLRDGDL